MYEGVAPELTTLMKEYTTLDDMIKFLQTSSYLYLSNRSHNSVSSAKDKSFFLDQGIVKKILDVCQAEQLALSKKLKDNLP